MRIEVTRSGGFAGLSRHAVLDTAARPDADHLHALAHSALAAPRSAPTTARDGFTYTLTIDGRTVETADPALTPEQRELIAQVLGEGA